MWSTAAQRRREVGDEPIAVPRRLESEDELLLSATATLALVDAEPEHRECRQEPGCDAAQLLPSSADAETTLVCTTKIALGEALGKELPTERVGRPARNGSSNREPLREKHRRLESPTLTQE